MNEIEINPENPTQDIKLYSAGAIGGATFLGGPLAAGYMIGENFKALDKPSEGKTSLIIGIIVTILLFGGVFLVPENIIDHIPKQLIPILYTAVVYGIVEWKQGHTLKTHKENGNTFYSAWRAAGIGLVSLLILSAGIFGYAFLSTHDEVYDQYEQEMSAFFENETETLVFYDHLESGTNQSLLQELEVVIPKWKENIIIINATGLKLDLSPELVKQNEILLKYAELRLETFELFKKAIAEDTDLYNLQLQALHRQIDEQIEKLN